MEHLNSVIESLTASTQHLPVFKEVSQKSGVASGYLALGLIVFTVLLMFFGVGADLITDLIGMFYPMYMSFKALETNEGEDDKLWLTYWVIYAFYKVADEWSSLLFFWVPFYYPIKLAFLIFLFAPQTKGAIKLYDGFVKPFITKHQADIESGITRLGETATMVSHAAKEEAFRRGTEYVTHSASKTE